MQIQATKLASLMTKDTETLAGMNAKSQDTYNKNTKYLKKHFVRHSSAEATEKGRQPRMLTGPVLRGWDRWIPELAGQQPGQNCGLHVC